jgi:hypothetical protein
VIVASTVRVIVPEVGNGRPLHLVSDLSLGRKVTHVIATGGNLLASGFTGYGEVRAACSQAGHGIVAVMIDRALISVLAFPGTCHIQLHVDGVRGAQIKGLLDPTLSVGKRGRAVHRQTPTR